MSTEPDALPGGRAGGNIVPRWEWRTFGEPLASRGTCWTTRAPDSTQESDELYVVSAHSDASVKVRDGLMDVKHLHRVDEAGLELWTPVMKAAFPLPADVLHSCWRR